MNLLLCTLGDRWQVVPESFGLLYDEDYDLYAQHPSFSSVAGMRDGLSIPDEIWICSAFENDENIAKVLEWWEYIGEPIPLRIWSPEGIASIQTPEDIKHIKEFVLRVVCKASQYRGRHGKLIMATGWKSQMVSSDFINSGQIFGCDSILQIFYAGKDAEECALTPEQLAQPLDEEVARKISPIRTTLIPRSEIIDARFDSRPDIDSSIFFIDLPAINSVTKVSDKILNESLLSDELDYRLNQSANLLGSYIMALDDRSLLGNWRNLYRLPPLKINELRSTYISERSYNWLKQLPKAELHCHIGGLLDIKAQKRVAKKILKQASKEALEAAQEACGAWLTKGWPDDWPKRLRHSESRHICASLLLSKTPVKKLEDILYADTEPRIGLKDRAGFSAYEKPGELSGSALLQTPEGVEAYAREIVDYIEKEGIRYLELRGSPQKYLQGKNHGMDFLEILYNAIKNELEAFQRKKPTIRFIVIVDRRKPEVAADIINMTIRANQLMSDFVVGLDLAGAEGHLKPQELAKDFEPAFEHCLPITIHAGEGEPPEHIWEASYMLNADRIGHGLTLHQNPRLLSRFRDRDICIELCPTSNREVVGFYDPKYPESENYPAYQLATLMNAGIIVTICTDNPGISRTTLTDEFITAARMIQDQYRMTHWDALLMIRQAYLSAFLTKPEKNQLMKEVDREIFNMLIHD